MVEFVVFEDGEDKMSCATFVPVQGADLASVALMSLDFQKQQHVICVLSAEGEIRPFKVAKNTAYIGGQDDEFKRKFVKGMLKRLGLTAADLPGINLEPVLSNGR